MKICGGSRLRAFGAIAALAAAAVVLLVPGTAGATPPSNDDFANALVLPGDTGTTSMPNAGSTFESGEPFAPASDGGSIWFSWTASSDGSEIIDTLGSSCVDASHCSNGADTYMTIYTGSSLSSLSSVATSDDCKVQIIQSCALIQATAGTTYYIQVTDNSWQTTANIVVNWRRPPPAPQISIPANFGPGNVTSDTQPTFVLTDSGSNDFVCSIDGATSGALFNGDCHSPYQVPTPLADGIHTFSVQTQDVATGIPGAPQILTFDVQTKPPAPTIDSTTASSSSRSASFTFSDAAAGATFLCSLDGAALSPCANPQPQTYTGLADGTHHTFAVQAQTALGTSDITIYGWTIADLTPPPAPTVTLVSPAQSPTSSTNAQITFADSESGVTFWCSLDNAAPTLCSNGSLSGLGNGTHTFSVYAKDAAGNLSAASNTVSWTVDTTPPPAPTIVSGPGNPTTSTSAAFTFSDGDASATLLCSLDGGIATPCTGGANYSPLAVGLHTLSVTARDAAGNVSPASVFTWTVNLPAPPLSGCDLGETHGHFEFTNPKVTVEVEADCDLNKKTGTLAIHHAKLILDDKSIKGGKQIAASTGGGDDNESSPFTRGDITSLRFTSPADAVITGNYMGTPFTVTLHDGGNGNGNKLDSLRVQWGAYDTATLSQKHGDVKVDQGK